MLRTAAAAVLSAVMLTGCALFAPDFDAAGYAKGVLDCTYKGEYAAYMEATGITGETAMESREQAVASGAQTLGKYLGIYDAFGGEALPEAVQDKLIETYELICHSVRYEIKEAIRNKKEYNVQVVAVPVDPFSIAVDEMNAAIQDMQDKMAAGEYVDISKEEFCTQYADTLLTICQKYAENPSYREEVMLNLEIKPDEDGLYHISEENFLRLASELICYPAAA